MSNRGGGKKIKQACRVSEEITNCFQKLLPAPHDPITRPFKHGIHHRPAALPGSAEISPDTDNVLFG
jgi:hypothetical protein